VRYALNKSPSDTVVIWCCLGQWRRPRRDRGDRPLQKIRWWQRRYYPQYL